MLWITSTPQNGSVFLDGRYIGIIPLQASGIRAGIHQIMVTHEGYQNWTRIVQIMPGQCTYVPGVMFRKE
ncbi:MAG: PEGA domain-containing protein [Methanobacteriota archaeon]